MTIEILVPIYLKWLSLKWLSSSSNLIEIPFAVFENLLILKFVLIFRILKQEPFLKSYVHWFGLLALVWINLNSLKVASLKGRFPGCMRNVFYVR